MQVTNASADMGLDASAQMRRMGNLSKNEQIKEAANQFEMVFLRQFLGESLKPMIKGCFGEDMPGGQIYQSMMVDTLADGIEKGGGMGLSNVLQLQLQQNSGGKAATNANSDKQ